MTNEQLAEFIAQGGNDELTPLLWEKMRKIYRMWADKYYSLHKRQCDLSGVTVDDLLQEGYLSMLEAVKAYYDRAERHKDNLLSSFCLYPFKNHAAKLIGMRTERDRSEPLNGTRRSLDEPLQGKEGDSDELMSSVIPDPEAEQPYRDIEQADYCRSIRETVAETLSDNKRELSVVECRYYKGKSLAAIGSDMGISPEGVRQLEKKAIRKLRNSKKLRELAEINYYTHVSVDSFRRNHKSAVEIIAEERERARNSIYNTFADTV